MGVTTFRPWDASENKVRPELRDLTAIVYVRQSSRQQVIEHSESTRLQYALVERAVSLGWARSRITVIDDDLGRSAAVADARPGFQKLVTEVTMGRVGVVLGIEMSRLARTGRDWHQLLELCSLSGTLLADPDGVYDPRYYNDRLLLGLKGTVSEAELYLIKQRMASGRLAKAERGELAVALPIGYVRRASGDVVLEPDEQARHVVRLVFTTFTRLGTLNAVLQYFAEHAIQLPVRSRGGPNKGELTWRRTSRETLQNMLHNPIYAGYYVYGRRRIDPRRKVPGRPSTGRVVCERDAWLVVLPDRLPAYISAEQFEANQARLEANRQIAQSPGAPRQGPALLAGLIHCGRCERKPRMVVRYPAAPRVSSAHSYICGYDKTNFGTGTNCQHLAGPALDAYVATQVLEAMAPATLEVCIQAAARAEAERAELDALWRQRLERVRYAADRARRQYQLAEPENRLVTRQLEKEWEAALAEVDQIEASYQRFCDSHPKVLTREERQAITALARDLPALWHARTTREEDRKELLRVLVERVTVAAVGDSERVDVTITWTGGHRTTGQAVRPVARLDQLSYWPQLLQRVTDLAEHGHTSAQIAACLNDEGFRPPKRVDHFNPGMVQAMMHRHGIRPNGHHRPAALKDLGPHQWGVSDLARELQMPTATVYTWIYRGWIPAMRAPDDSCWIITADAAVIEQLRERRARPSGYYTRRRWTEPFETPTSEEGDPT
jgi:DNA invertase Pin-like site-specific DNA recombinase